MKLQLVAATLCVFVVSCGGGPETAKEDTSSEPPSAEQMKQMQDDAAKIIDQQLSRMQEKEAARFPCSLFSQQEIETIVGNAVDKGSYAFNNVSEDDRSYKSESCDWSAKGGEGNEANVWVSLPRHFASGRVECSPASGSKEVSGIGDRAWWDYKKSFGMGTLRACSSTAMFEVRVIAKGKDEPEARKIAQTIGEKVLAPQ